MAISINENGIYKEDGSSLLEFKEIQIPKISGVIVDSLIGDNGYVKFDNGFMIQWGYNKLSNTSRYNYYDIPFPISFPNKVLNIQITSREGTALDNYGQYFYEPTVSTTLMTQSGFKFRIIDASGGSGDVGINWIAFGF